MDQCFSILASEFKAEIKTVEELFLKMENAPIVPKAEVQHLLYIWDWKKFITPNFTTKMLANHSHYHSFQVKRDGKLVALRCKKYPQDKVWLPFEGIKLVKDNTSYDPVGAAAFREGDLNLEKVMSDLRKKYFPIVSDQERKKVESSWEKLCTTLIQMPKKCLPEMKLQDLVKQQAEVIDIANPSYLQEHVETGSPPELRGELHPPPEAEEMEFMNDARVGLDVVLWTHTKSTRPWVGRVHEVLNSEEFVINWFERRHRSNTFLASRNEDGSLYLSKQPMSSVMCWQMSVNVKEDSFDLSQYEMKRIMHEYLSHDECYKD